MIQATSGNEVLASLRRREAAAPSVSVPFTGRPVGVRWLGRTYSCVPDAVYPWDPDVVRAIWRFDPSARPIWVKDIFQVPLEDSDAHRVIVYGRHGIARKIENLRGLEPLQVEMPSMPVLGLRFDAPNYEPVRWFDRLAPGKYPEAPGAYLPFDFEFAKWLEMTRMPHDEALWVKTFVTDKQVRELERKRQRDDMHNYLMREVRKFTSKILENTSEVEMMERERWRRSLNRSTR